MAMLSTFPARSNFVLGGLLLTLILFYISFRASTSDERRYSGYGKFHGNDAVAAVHAHGQPGHLHKSLLQVQNETLGFQEIYMISLPGRTDKQDSFAMSAAFSNISYNQENGVYGDEVPLQALPHTMGQDAKVIGCWRAHMNVYQKMVHEKVATALIFEDDADWDVSLKHQLVQFARGSRFILNSTEHVLPQSPYGDDWDILFIGHCGTWVLPADDRRYFVIPDDITVQPPEHRNDNVDQPNMSRWESMPGGNRTRIVFRSEGAVCTAGYAISQRAARKALYHMSMEPYNSPIDWGLINLCKNPEYDFVCISPWPQLIGVSRPTGSTVKYSDIGYGVVDTTVEQEHSLHLVYPMRLNMPGLLKGNTTFHSQYPDIAPPLNIEEIGSAVGHAEILEPEKASVRASGN